MIPGWSPQVGVIKPFQKIENYNLNESVVNLTNPNEDLNPSPSLSKNQPFFSPNSVVTNLGMLFFFLFFWKLNQISWKYE